MRTFYFCLLLLVCFSSVVFGQNVGINESGSNPDASAILDVASDNKGILIPRVGLISVNDPINDPETSLLVFNTSTSGTYPTPGFYYFDGTDWVPLAGGGGAPTPTNEQTIFQEATSTVTATVNTSISPFVQTLVSSTITPINSKIIITASCGAETTSTNHPPLDHRWGFRVIVGGVAGTAGFVFEDAKRHHELLNADRAMSTTIQVPFDVTPGVPVNVSLQVLHYPTRSGFATFTMNPNSIRGFANIKIEDKPF